MKDLLALAVSAGLSVSVNDLLSSPLHVLCIAGPDAGLGFPVTSKPVIMGRNGDVQVKDPLTSRRHLQVKGIYSRGGFEVALRDLGSANGFAVGRKAAILPGFARSWVLLRSMTRTLRRARINEASAKVAPGRIFCVGGNLWQVRSRPSTMNLQKALEWGGARPMNKRGLLLLLPMLSLIWLIGRLLGWQVAVTVVFLMALAISYGVLALRSRRKPGCRWGILYGLSMPARGKAGAATSSSEKAPSWRNSKEVEIDLSAAPTWTRCSFPLPKRSGYVLGRVRFSPGSVVSVRVGESLALSDVKGWATWVLSQALVYARESGIDARVLRQSPNVLRDEEGAALLTVLNASKHVADHRVECPPGVPLRPVLPVGEGVSEVQIPTRVLVEDLPVPMAGPDLSVPIGNSETGTEFLDLVKDGPHALVAGTTGSGKSEALRTWILQMCRKKDPSKLRLVLIDYKGGAAFRDLAQLPHAQQLLTDLAPDDTERAIAGLGAELREREEALAARQFVSVDQWEQRSPDDCPARIVCVIDEFRAMIRTHPATLESLVDLAARGRSLGVHLIAATQSPGGVVTPSMRANLTLRVCLRTASVADSLEMVASGAASELPRVPGRAVVDAGSMKEVQWAYFSHLESNLGALQETVSEGEVPALWRPPLPELVSPGFSADLAREADPPGIGDEGGPIIGWLDDVAGRTYRPLRLEEEKVAVVADEGELLEKIASACGALYIPAKQRQVFEALHQMDFAARKRVPVVVEDLGALLRAIDGSGFAQGQEWLREWMGRAAGVVAGVSADDYSLVRTWRRSLVKVTAQQARGMGLVRTGAKGLIAHPWGRFEGAAVSIVDSEGAALVEVVRPINPAEGLLALVQDGVLSTGSEALVACGGNSSERVWLVGEFPSDLKSQILVDAARNGREVVEATETVLLAGGYQPERSEVSVVGKLPRHVLRTVSLPLFVKLGASEDAAYWAGCCEVWYRIGAPAR